ncbi:MAG: hypothetical protein RR139_04180 [Lachnospiraceae bacterium]
MARVPNTHGGGTRTNMNRLRLEQTTSLDDALIAAGYKMIDYVVYKDGIEIGMSVPQKRLYTYFLNPHHINYKDYNSKEWHPDEAFIHYELKTAFIIEKKFQHSSGSVDEKLPNCHFKKLEYRKLFSPLDFKVEFIYIFNDWFKDPRYKDTLEYIKTMGCHYFYNS